MDSTGKPVCNIHDLDAFILVCFMLCSCNDHLGVGILDLQKWICLARNKSIATIFSSIRPKSRFFVPNFAYRKAWSLK